MVASDCRVATPDCNPPRFHLRAVGDGARNARDCSSVVTLIRAFAPPAVGTTRAAAALIS